MPAARCKLDEEKRRILWPCMAHDWMLESARDYVEFDPFLDPDGFPFSCLSKQTVVYSCGRIARRDDLVAHNHPAGEQALCRRLATQANNAMSGLEVGMGSEGTPIDGVDTFSPFYITANRDDTRPDTLNEDVVRQAFGDVIAPGCRIWVEPLVEEGEWWESVLHWYSDSEEDYVAPRLAQWRRMIAWFHRQKDFRESAFLMIGNSPEDGGACFPRLAVGVTKAGSLAGIAGAVVHT